VSEVCDVLMQYPMGLDGHCLVTVSCHESSPLEHKFVFSTPHQSAGFINTMKGTKDVPFHRC